MFVDTDVLRCGADFSRSAGEIARRGAEQFASASLPVGIFGDFEAAQGFHRALRRAHEAHVTTMQGHGAELDALAEKGDAAAGNFRAQDEASGSALESAARDVS